MTLDDINVVDLLDKHGKVVGYATGTAKETAVMSQSVWTASNAPSTNAIDVLKAAMATRVQDVRRSSETNGMQFGGNIIATDVGSQVKLVAALLHTHNDPSFSTIWKTLDNKYLELDAEGISDTCAAMLAYVQSCYKWEQSMLASIKSAQTIEELKAIDLRADKPQGSPPVAPPVVDRSPTATRGVGSGTSSVIALAAGSSDKAGQITVTAGGKITIAPGSPIVTVTFDRPYKTAPFVVLQAASPSAGGLAAEPYVTCTPNGFTLCVSTTLGCLAVKATYMWTYHVVA
jgi:Domain of unknown function (DUF4376)